MKLYIITRADLPPGARAAQSCHALRAFVQRCPEFDREWFESSNNIVLLEVNTLKDLEELVKEISWSKHPWATFHEADFNNELTAIAVGGGDNGIQGYEGRSITGSLRLALKSPCTTCQLVADSA
jgi:peptidyl-tRNA hydrolase